MNAKKLMTMALAGLLATAAHAITSDEIAAALDVDPSIGTFSTGGDAEWFVVADAGTNGSPCVRSGVIGDSKATTLTFTMQPVTLPSTCTITFWKKVSSESSCDVLTAFGTRYGNDNTWKQLVFNFVVIPGEIRSFTFGYTKDGSVSSGSDCAWIDGFALSVVPVMQKSSAVEVANIKCTQRYPWNGMVDIDYTVKCEKADADVWVYPVGYDKDSNKTMAPRSLTGDGVNAPVKAGTHRMTWTVTDDYSNFNSTAFAVKMIALTGAAPYMVVDLSGGVDALSYPVTYLSSVPAGGWSDEYKTTKLVLRLIPPGNFIMGSPTDESGRSSNESLHDVLLSKPFYIGVFECTQKQYQLVMGTTPSYNKGDMRPVERVSYYNLRGSVNGVGWPTHNQVDADSFMGRLRSKVNFLFDLPTEAEWECACRAGSSSALNNGKAYSELALKEVARCSFNNGYDYTSDGKGGFSRTTNVGCYLENAWGLYDMHGNVGEMCRDYGNDNLGSERVADPKGNAGSGSCRLRGGTWRCSSNGRSASRASWSMSSTSDEYGFRVYCSPVAQ